MATTDELVEQVPFGIEQTENCAKQLKKLADDSETHRKKCNTVECFGSIVSMVGAACLIMAGMDTMFTSRTAVPSSNFLETVISSVGVTLSVGAKITKHLLSRKIMKEVQTIKEKNAKITENIQTQLKQLKAEMTEMDSFKDPGELDAQQMVRRQSHDRLITFSVFDNKLHLSIEARPKNKGPNQMFISVETVGLVSILTFFTFQVNLKGFNILVTKGAENLIKEMLTTGLYTTLKGGAMVMGGGVGLPFAFFEALRKCKAVYKKHYVTYASQSLRDEADDILKISQTMKKQLDDIKNHQTQKQEFV